MNLLIYLLQVTCCLSFFYALYHFTLRKETMFATNRIYLVLTLALSMVLPLIKIYIDSRTGDPVFMAPAVYVGSYMETITTEWKEIPVSPFPWHRLILGIYSIGIAFMLIRLLSAIKQIQSIKRSGKQTWIDGKWCVLSEKVKSPFSFLDTIYFPANHAFNEDELKEVIAHEMAHVEGRHTWDILFMEFGCILLWPSPVVYLYRKALKDVHEYVADAAVLKETPWEHYAQLLLSQQQGQLQNILSNQLIYSQLKKRLVMMNTERSSVIARYKYLGVVPVLLIAIVLFSFREKMDIPQSTTATSEQAEPGRVLTLNIDADKKIYFKLMEIPKAELEATLRKQISLTSDTLLNVLVTGSLNIEDIGEIGAIGQRLNIRTEFYADTMYGMYKSDLQSHNKHGNMPYLYNSDTLPKVDVIALRLTEPTDDHKDDLMLQDQNALDNQQLDYELGLPIFPGCDDVEISERGMCGMAKLGEHINKYLVYPKQLKDKGIEGRVVVKFVVGADGYVKDVAIHESLDPEADQTVLNLVNAMNARVGKWRPARKEGKSYDAEMFLPVKFALDHTAVKEEPLVYAEELPRFPGCESISDTDERSACASRKMYEFIYTTIQYPKEDRANNVQGMCIVQFVIGDDGSISDIKVVRSPSESMKAEVTRIMNEMAAMPEKWIPARQDGKAVAMRFTLPIKFQLQDNTTQSKTDPAEAINQDIRTNAGHQTNSVKDIPVCEDINIVPNPASETITLKVVEGSTSINIFDASGKLMKSQKVNAKANDKETINITGLPAGRYSVQLITTTGSVACSFMIVK